MIKFFLGVAATLGGLAFIGSPAGKAALAELGARLQGVPAVTVRAALPKLSQEELPPPPESAPEPAEAASETQREVSPEARAEDTFTKIISIYEEDGKAGGGG